MELKAITYNYTTDGYTYHKVIGIIKKEQLKNSFDKIIELFNYPEIIKYEESNENYFLEFNDDEKSWFYSGDYTLGEIKI